ncbi:MAG: MBL fold metallo-hydrolase [Thermoplasmata archaeon]|nr:MBL fold metallo-hydrolase [Thermoplasmata archaeon]
MMIKIYAIGGYNEVGKNMTCIEVDDEAIILDMGLYMDRFVALQERNIKMNPEILVNEDAIPNDEIIKKLRKKVKAILITHAHLDHIGAIKWMAYKYKCPIITTPYTGEIIKRNAKNVESVSTNVNSFYRVSKNIEAEFINVTHSVPQSAIINIKTKYGSILYGLDYKNDSHPALGKKTNIKKLKKIEDVVLLIADSTNADEERKTFSEQIAKEMLRDIMIGMENEGHGLFLTTFSSHIARLKSILNISKIIGRKVVFIGRSLNEYISAAEKLKIVNFSKDAEIIGNAGRSEEKLREMNKNKDEYVFVVTGGMGEKNAVLTRIVNDEIALKIDPQDFVIFSCNVIPTPIIQANRKVLEQKLHRKRARIFKDIHVSGHASREDLRDLIKIVSPRHILPAHGGLAKTAAMASLGGEMGYELGKNIHIMQNGQSMKLL